MSDSSEWAENGIIIMVLVVFLVLVITIPFGLANEEQTKREAIKAGLVQDDNGHWVQPILEIED